MPALGIMKGSERFRGFGPQEEHAVRKPEPVISTNLEPIMRLWDVFEITKVNMDAVSPRFPDDRGMVAGWLESIKYSAREIEEFTVALSAFTQDKDFSSKAGVFLDALMRSCPDNDIVLHTAHLPWIDGLGMHNTKNILIKGRVGDSCGEEMLGGSITVEGDCLHYIGVRMVRGTIIVEGNAGMAPGAGMQSGLVHVKGNADCMVGNGLRGGTVIVEGNAGRDLGGQMTRGRIIVNGKIEEISGMIQGGRVYQGKTLLFPRPGEDV